MFTNLYNQLSLIRIPMSDLTFTDLRLEPRYHQRSPTLPANRETTCASVRHLPKKTIGTRYYFPTSFYSPSSNPFKNHPPLSSFPPSKKKKEEKSGKYASLFLYTYHENAISITLHDNILLPDTTLVIYF